jgi:hypothetical protein
MTVIFLTLEGPCNPFWIFKDFDRHQQVQTKILFFETFFESRNSQDISNEPTLTKNKFAVEDLYGILDFIQHHWSPSMA